MAREVKSQSVQAQKLQLIEQILQIDNGDMLSLLSEIVKSSQNPGVYQLNEDEALGIKKGLEDFKEGRTVSHDEALLSLSRWL